jgi:hypothetical protein
MHAPDFSRSNSQTPGHYDRTTIAAESLHPQQVCLYTCFPITVGWPPASCEDLRVICILDLPSMTLAILPLWSLPILTTLVLGGNPCGLRRKWDRRFELLGYGAEGQDNYCARVAATVAKTSQTMVYKKQIH